MFPAPDLLLSFFCIFLSNSKRVFCIDFLLLFAGLLVRLSSAVRLLADGHFYTEPGHLDCGEEELKKKEEEGGREDERLDESMNYSVLITVCVCVWLMVGLWHCFLLEMPW